MTALHSSVLSSRGSRRPDERRVGAQAGQAAREFGVPVADRDHDRDGRPIETDIDRAGVSRVRSG